MLPFSPLSNNLVLDSTENQEEGVIVGDDSQLSFIHGKSETENQEGLIVGD